MLCCTAPVILKYIDTTRTSPIMMPVCNCTHKHPACRYAGTRVSLHVHVVCVCTRAQYMLCVCAHARVHKCMDSRIIMVTKLKGMHLTCGCMLLWVRAYDVHVLVCARGLVCECEYVHVSVHVHVCINVGNAYAPTYTCGCSMLLGIVL